MDGERRRYQLRSASRSRSRTPSVRNGSSREHESPERHDNSDVPTNHEELHTSIEATVETHESFPHDGIVDASNLRVELALANDPQIPHGSQSKKVESETSVCPKRPGRQSARQKGKRQIFSNGCGEMAGDLVDEKCKERHEKVCSRTILTSDYSSEEGERDDFPGRPRSAFEIYKQAGDWWNVFPKTDYTYSENSKCRYEIAPGVQAMPNMSRRSLRSNGSSGTFDSVTSMSKRNFSQTSEGLVEESGFGDTTDIEESKEIRKRSCMCMDGSYEWQPRSHSHSLDGKSKIQQTQTHVERFQCHREIIYTVPESSVDLRNRRSLQRGTASERIDSDTELEEAVSVSGNRYDRRWKLTRWCSSVTTIIVLWFSKMLEFLKLRTVRRREHRTSYDYYGGRYNEPKWHKAWKHIDRYLQYVYLVVVQMFIFDAWLLSCFPTLGRWLQRKGPKILWIVALLPLLLLTGYWCLSYLSMPISSTRIISTQAAETLLNGQTVKLMDESEKQGCRESSRTIDFELIAEKLSRRMDKLEDRNVDEMKRISNTSEMLEELMRRDLEVSSEYNGKILVLEKKLEQMTSRDDIASVNEMEAIKLEFEGLKELYSRLQSCCVARVESVTNDDLEKRVETLLAEYFGVVPSKKHLTYILRMLVDKSVEEGEGEGIADEEKAKMTHKLERNIATDDTVTVELVREIVKEVLKTYDADKTGRVDYALESAGGQIISTRCTQKYDINTRAFKFLVFTLYHENNNPRTVIQGNPIQPGACWAFQGFPGYLLIKLRSLVYITGFTIEHAPKSILPNGEMRSAPRKFNVWGFIDENDSEPVMFGDYEFVASDDNLQYFPIQNMSITVPYEYIELRVHSNHGQLEYTCLYRFRVHGTSV